MAASSRSGFCPILISDRVTLPTVMFGEISGNFDETNQKQRKPEIAPIDDPSGRVELSSRL
jgi:hypothetical protein